MLKKIMPLLGLALLISLLWKIGLTNVIRLLSNANFNLILVSALLIFLVVIVGKSIRYQIIASKVGDFKTLFWIALVGQMFNQINIAASEISKSLLLNKKFKIRTSEAAAPSAIERLGDLLAVLTFGVIGAIYYFKIGEALFIVPLIIITIMILIFKWPFSIFKEQLGDFKASVKKLGLRSLFSSYILSLFLWFSEGFAFTLLLSTMDIHIGLLESIAAFTISFAVSTSLFMTIGGLEGALVLFYTTLGVNTEAIFGAAILYRLIILLEVIPSGLIGNHLLNKKT